MIEAGAHIRVTRKNDADVPIGWAGVVTRLHPDTGWPVVAFIRDGAPARITAMLPGQIEVTAGPSASAIAPRKEQSVPALAGKNGTSGTNGLIAVADAVQRRYLWQVCDPRQVYVAVGKAGLKLSPAAADYLAGASTVELLFDRANRAIGVRPGKGSRAVSVKRESGGGIVIACPAFIALLDVSSSRQGNPLRYAAAWDTDEQALIAADVAFKGAS